MNTELQPSVLKWARLRAGLAEDALAKKIEVKVGVVNEWETTGKISYSHLEKLAAHTGTPFGFLFLAEPPEEKLPISDFRRVHGTDAKKPPSRELIDVIYQCQQRQQWYREYLISNGNEPNPFVGKFSTSRPVEETAKDIRKTLKIGSALTVVANTWEDALRQTMENIEDAGILVNRTGFAGHTRRILSIEEFRGFALYDEYAPLIFINGVDVPAAQFFTIAHEIAHIWIGESAVFNLDKTYSGTDSASIERYCNKVAAEVMVPLEDLKSAWKTTYNSKEEIERLSKKYKVSRVVIARRAMDAGFITQHYYNTIYSGEVKSAKKAAGGNYYLAKPYQTSHRFSVALIRDTRNGRTLFHDAMKLLGIRKSITFERYAHSLQLDW